MFDLTGFMPIDYEQSDKGELLVLFRPARAPAEKETIVHFSRPIYWFQPSKLVRVRLASLIQQFDLSFSSGR